jgi:tagatose kinase
MPVIASVGELLVEIMRDTPDVPLASPGVFRGPYPSGAPAIFIDAAARLGCETKFFGMVGDDAFGACVRDRLAVDGVDVSGIVTEAGQVTGTAFVGYAADGSREFVFNLKASASAYFNRNHVDDNPLSQMDWLHISGSTLALSDGCARACLHMAETVKQHGGRISFDPNVRPELMNANCLREVAAPLMSLCDVFLPSSEELSLFTGIADQEEVCRTCIKQGMLMVCLKQGEDGCLITTADGAVHLPGFAVTQVDPTGAGDCFAAGIAVGMLCDLSIEQTGLLANAAGALATTQMGPMEGACTWDEAARLIETETGVIIQ